MTAMDRRALLLGAGVVGAGVATGLSRPEAAAAAAKAAPGAVGSDLHQAGITTPQQPSALVVSFDVLATTREDLARLLRILTVRVAALVHGGRVPTLDPGLPPADSGLLGPVISTPDLTITVAVGASLFDGRFGLADRRPRHLAAMPRFANDAPDPAMCHGDLLLQICSGSAEANIHALRDVIRHTPDLLALRWQMGGFRHAEARDTPRNLLGFKDGTANPHADDAAAMDRIVWVGAGSGEPDWAEGGTYQVVRIVRNLVERWDRTSLREQQEIIGREKMTGAPLGRAHEQDDPDYAGDPHGARIRLDAHIRLANPRTKATDSSIVLRRGYNYSRGVTSAGQLDMGLLFICFQSDLSRGFAAVQARLDGEPLEEYIKPVGGGYFFVLPTGRGDGVIGDGLLTA